MGVAIIGQTGNLAPADKRFYATRDVTATVESIPLITASILSKKLAAGLDALVMDVKTGDGAFMPTHEMSQQLARSIVDVANGAGVRTSALLTDMNESLASCAGNAVEVAEAVEFLKGNSQNARLQEVTMALSAELLMLGGLAADENEARQKLQRALDAGTAAEVFQKMIAGLGGPADFVESPSKHLPAAAVIRPVYPTSGGFIAGVHTRKLGMAVVQLGGGRRTTADAIDHAVGLSRMTPIGNCVDADRPLATVHARHEDEWNVAAKQVRECFILADHPPKPNPVVYEYIR